MKFHFDDIPKDIADYLEAQVEAGVSFDGPLAGINWEPERYFIGSEIIPLRGRHRPVCGVEANSKTHKFVESWRSAGGKLGNGFGFAASEEFANVGTGEIFFELNPDNERAVRTALSGVRIISQPNCLLIGADVFDVVNALEPVPRDRYVPLEVKCHGSDKTFGRMYYYDPKVREDVIEWENSSTKWCPLEDGYWSCRLGLVLPSTVSIRAGKNILIARIAYRNSNYLISKDLAYTLYRSGVKGFDGRDPHKIYFQHEYKPKDLLVGER